MSSYFDLIVFATLFFAIWISFKKMFPAMIFLFFTLLFFSYNIPPIALSFIELFMAVAVGSLIYRYITNKLIN